MAEDQKPPIINIAEAKAAKIAEEKAAFSETDKKPTRQKGEVLRIPKARES